VAFGPRVTSLPTLPRPPLTSAATWGRPPSEVSELDPAAWAFLCWRPSVHTVRCKIGVPENPAQLGDIVFWSAGVHILRNWGAPRETVHKVPALTGVGGGYEGHGHRLEGALW